MLTPETAKIVVIGLGYVGLPLAVEFGRKIPTVGFDINAVRIAELRRNTTARLKPRRKSLERPLI